MNFLIKHSSKNTSVKINPYPYIEILRISPYSVQMRENADQNKSEYEHFLRSGNGTLASNVLI